MKSELLRKIKQVGHVIYEEPSMDAEHVSELYLDIKRAYGTPDILNALCHFIYAHLEQGTNCIASRGNGGVPLATAVSLEYNIRQTIVRDLPRGHGGCECWFDGHVPTKEDSIAVIDDVFTMGRGTRKTIRIVEQTGAKVIGCTVVYRRGDGNLDDLKIPIKYLFLPADLV